MKHLITIFIILLLCSACARNYSTVARDLKAASVCCASESQFSFTPLKAGMFEKFEMGTASPAYQFAEGKSFFRAYSLPETSTPYRVTVNSFLASGHLKSSYLFYPRLVTLDKEFKTVRVTMPGTFIVEHMGMIETMSQGGGAQYKLTGSLTFGPENRRERYLVIHTTDELLRGSTPVPVGGEAVLLYGSLPKKDEVRVHNAPAGHLNVRVTAVAAATVSVPAPVSIPAPVPAPAAAPVAVSAAPAVPSKSAPPAAVPLVPSPSQPVPAPPSAAKPIPLLSISGSSAAPSILPERLVIRHPQGGQELSFELGTTDLAGVRQILEKAGIPAGAQRPNVLPFVLGPVHLKPSLVLAPEGVAAQFFFDEKQRLVLLVDRAPVSGTAPSSSREFAKRYGATWETGRTLSSVEYQTAISRCVTLTASYRAVDDSLDSVAFGYACTVK